MSTSTSSPASLLPPSSRPDERAAASVRRAAFPFRFPRDQRLLGGKYSVEENSHRLMRFFYFERRLSQGLGSWTLAIPEFEVKVESGRHIFWHMEAARTLRVRLSEQERRLPQIDGFRDAEIDAFFDETLSAVDTPELLIGMHQVIGRALETAYRHHIDNTCPVADAPTVRALTHILLDYQPMLAWADEVIAAYIEGGVDESRLSSWRWHLSQLLTAIGGVTGSDARCAQPANIRSKEKPFERGTVPMRDNRFRTFATTGDFDVFDGTPRYREDTYDHERLDFIRTQRDEVDAIEAFGTFLWDVRFKDFDAEYSLARITWDESRHTEMGHRAMLAAGYDPFELPNRLTSSTCRGPMEAAYAMAEINLFGEVGVMKQIGGLINRAKDHNDTLLAHIADFVRSDERTHVKKGQHILKQMTHLDMPALELRTREVFTECLVGLGAIQPGENGFVLSREDIEHYIGE